VDKEQILRSGITKRKEATDDAHEVEEHQTVKSKSVLADFKQTLLARMATGQAGLDPLPRRYPALAEQALLLGADKVDAEALHGRCAEEGNRSSLAGGLGAR
jgi:hypothetical protein